MAAMILVSKQRGAMQDWKKNNGSWKASSGGNGKKTTKKAFKDNRRGNLIKKVKFEWKVWSHPNSLLLLNPTPTIALFVLWLVSWFVTFLLHLMSDGWGAWVTRPDCQRPKGWSEKARRASDQMFSFHLNPWSKYASQIHTFNCLFSSSKMLEGF